MRSILPTLALAAAATALPNHAPRSCAPTSRSKGFYLSAHATDPSNPLTPFIDGLVLGTAHTGAGSGAAVFYGSDPTTGRLFYQNGTAAQVAAGDTTIVTDGGTPLFPSSLQVQTADEARRIADISVGYGTPNVIRKRGKGPDALVNTLDEAQSGTYLACNATVPYYRREFITLQYLYGVAEGSALPEACAPILLLPRCGVLEELPEGSISSHEFAVEVKCGV
jgi:hypothetical protein